ncbi:MAG TPA: hypothetical protein VEY12_12080 [Thermoplasmata archaeon]|nr:hypothetical protein [Thermoplasmata archaeon]
MPRRLLSLLARAGLLFLLSVVLVFGFWEHRNFYQIGFTNLLILGGLVTFLVILGFRLALSGDLPRRRPLGELAFTLDEGDRILRGGAELTIRPLRDEAFPVVGQVVRATYDTGREFGRLLVVDGTRKLLADLTEDEARRAGYRTAAELRDAGMVRWRWKPGDLVAILRLRPLGGGR